MHSCRVGSWYQNTAMVSRVILRRPYSASSVLFNMIYSFENLPHLRYPKVMILVTMSRRMKALEGTWQALMTSQILKSSHGMGCWLKMGMTSLCIALSSSSVHQLICRKKNCAFYIQKPWPRPSQARAKPEPSQVSWLWPGLGFEKAKATWGQAKARAFRPSGAGTALTTLPSSVGTVDARCHGWVLDLHDMLLSH